MIAELLAGQIDQWKPESDPAVEAAKTVALKGQPVIARVIDTEVEGAGPLAHPPEQTGAKWARFDQVGACSPCKMTHIAGPDGPGGEGGVDVEVRHCVGARGVNWWEFTGCR